MSVDRRTSDVDGKWKRGAAWRPRATDETSDNVVTYVAMQLISDSLQTQSGDYRNAVVVDAREPRF